MDTSMSTSLGISNSSVTVIGRCDNATFPKQETSDYIEITWLAVAFLLGAPLNLCAFTKLIERRNQHGMTRMLLLKLHICVTDVMVVFVYIGIKLASLMTYEWRGGPLLCPITTGYFSFIVFSSSSNVIVCIAVDRLLTVLFPRDHTGPTAFTRVKWMLVAAWILAGVSALPQLFIFRQLAMVNKKTNAAFCQCASIWMAKRIEHYCSGGNQSDLVMLEVQREEQYYNGAHTIVIFWLPLMIILACYIYILCWACYHMGTGCTPYGQTRCEMIPATDLAEPMDLPPDFATATGARKSTLQTPNENYTVSSYPGNYTLTVTPHAGRYGHRYSSRSSAQFPALIRAKRKLLRSTLFIVFAYILCWLPYQVLQLLHSFDTHTYEESIKNFKFLESFMVFNSVINPFLYGGVFSMDTDCSCFKSLKLPERLRKRDEKVIPTVKVQKTV